MENREKRKIYNNFNNLNNDANIIIDDLEHEFKRLKISANNKIPIVDESLKQLDIQRKSNKIIICEDNNEIEDEERIEGQDNVISSISSKIDENNDNMVECVDNEDINEDNLQDKGSITYVIPDTVTLPTNDIIRKLRKNKSISKKRNMRKMRKLRKIHLSRSDEVIVHQPPDINEVIVHQPPNINEDVGNILQFDNNGNNDQTGNTSPPEIVFDNIPLDISIYLLGI